MQIIRPKMTPRQVWSQYGFPLVSKQVSERIHDVRINPNSNRAKKCLGDGFFSIPQKWRFLNNRPYETSDMCCTKLKKEPMHKFEKESGRSPIIGVMASESLQRERKYIHDGSCNVFAEQGRSYSFPLVIWTESDIWSYIHKYNLEIAEIYNKGLDRTGCMGCGYGACRKDDIRFAILLKTHPKCYDMVMNYTNNGVPFREALRDVLAVNGLYLPDEQPQNLFSNIENER